MAFQFSLQSVLRLRAAFERMERLRLLALSSAVARLRQEIAAIDRAHLKIREDTQSKLAGGMTAAEIHFAIWSASAHLERRGLLLAQVEELKKKREAQERVYAEARQKLEIVESLRAGQRREYLVEQSRREQSRVDELFLMRNGRVIDPESE